VARGTHPVSTFSVSTRSCLIVYDEHGLPFGILRLRERGSPGTHNGMRSVVASLESDAIPRLRIGISQASPGEATRRPERIHTSRA